MTVIQMDAHIALLEQAEEERLARRGILTVRVFSVLFLWAARGVNCMFRALSTHKIL